MEPIIYKPGAYKTPGVYKTPGIYKGTGVYKYGESGNFPENLIALFYGDYDPAIDNYVLRAFNDKIIESIRNTGKANYISSSLIENTPIGNIPVFKSYNTNGEWNICAITKNNIKVSNFTIDFWIKYNNAWGERCQVGQYDYIIEGVYHWFVTGPYSNRGFYYNGGVSGRNFDSGFKQPYDDTYHHLEFDVDITNHLLSFYFDGEKKNEITLADYISQVTKNDVFSDIYVLNDRRNHPEQTYTQLAFWNKLMNGNCYRMGLYHDGNKFLI